MKVTMICLSPKQDYESAGDQGVRVITIIGDMEECTYNILNHNLHRVDVAKKSRQARVMDAYQSALENLERQEKQVSKKYYTLL